MGAAGEAAFFILPSGPPVIRVPPTCRIHSPSLKMHMHLVTASAQNPESHHLNQVQVGMRLLRTSLYYLLVHKRSPPKFGSLKQQTQEGGIAGGRPGGCLPPLSRFTLFLRQVLAVCPSHVPFLCFSVFHV